MFLISVFIILFYLFLLSLLARKSIGIVSPCCLPVTEQRFFLFTKWFVVMDDLCICLCVWSNIAQIELLLKEKKKKNAGI